MTPKQFWEDDPQDFFAYWDAYEMKRKQDAIDKNIEAFNQGQYFLLALAQALQFTKHPKKIYPKKPLELQNNNEVKMTQKEYEEIRKIQLRQLEKQLDTKK